MSSEGKKILHDFTGQKKSIPEKKIILRDSLLKVSLRDIFNTFFIFVV